MIEMNTNDSSVAAKTWYNVTVIGTKTNLDGSTVQGFIVIPIEAIISNSYAPEFTSPLKSYILAAGN